MMSLVSENITSLCSIDPWSSATLPLLPPALSLDKYTDGRSTYAVSKEADVHLKVLLDFLSTGGSPQNYREEEQTYNRDHLNRLARWIDVTDAPPSAGLGVIREAVVETDGSSDRSASSSRSVSRSVSRANSGRQLTGGATTGSSSKKQQQQQQQREPSVLDEFLESVDSRLVSTGVGHRLVALGVTRPGQVHDLSLRQLTHEAGVKKLLARRLKNAEAVHFDAERMRRGQSPFTGRNEAGVGVDDDEDEEECGEGDDNEEEEKREQDLEELLQQAAALGMQGPELERAREAILKKKAEKLEALEQEDDQTPPHSVVRWFGESQRRLVVSYFFCLLIHPSIDRSIHPSPINETVPSPLACVLR
jgi:hypothetical protein